ncbi:MAG: RNA polymerase sigma factor [Planctomycetota bacterium]|jgi:RNA polymerase sigma-70 factor (ECF subfamily)
MSGSPVTRPSLLLRIRDPKDEQAWRQFVEVYAPLVDHYGRRHGLQAADTADLAQEVLQAVAGAAGRFDYDPQRGSFRGWLFMITRNKLRNVLASRRRHPRASGRSDVKELLEQQPDPEPDEAAWNRQYQWRLFSWAAERIRGDFQDSTWQAFWQSAAENRPAKEIAEQLGLSVGAVYIAKSRVLARLRQTIQQVVDE